VAELDSDGLGVTLTVAREALLELRFFASQAPGIGLAVAKLLLDLFETSETLEELLSFLRPEDRGAVARIGEKADQVAIPRDHVPLGSIRNGFPDLQFGYTRTGCPTDEKPSSGASVR
jgi:hypothetical protein